MPDYEEYSPTDKNKSKRFKYWIDKFHKDVNAKCYKEWVEQIKLSRDLRNNDLKAVMKALNAATIADDREYWYADSGANRLEDFHLGRMLMAGVSVKVKEDTKTGNAESEAATAVADVLNDWLTNTETKNEMGRFGADYIMDGTGVMSHYAYGTIDPKTGAPEIRYEYADALEFVFDSGAKTLNQVQYIFRLRRKSTRDLKFLYNAKATPDRITEYFGISETPGSPQYDLTDKMTDLLEVQFINQRKTKNYIIPPELAQQMGVSEVMSEEEVKQIPELLMNPGVKEVPIIIEEYLYDCFTNGKSLLDAPKPLVWDKNLNKDGWNYTIAHFKEKTGTPYGMGLIFFQRDKMIIRLMLMTILMITASRYRKGRFYFDINRLYDAKDQMRLLNGEGGGYAINGDPKNIEWYPHRDDIDTTLLSFVQYIDQNIRDETGVTMEQTGGTPFAGAPAAAIAMLQQSGSIQLAMRLDKYFRTMEESIKKHFVLLREYQGLLEVPDAVLEIAFDTKTDQDKQQEGMLAMNLYQAGLIPGETVLTKNGYSDNPELLMQRRQLEDLGKLVQGTPQLAQIVQQFLTQAQGGTNDQSGNRNTTV